MPESNPVLVGAREMAERLGSCPCTKCLAEMERRLNACRKGSAPWSSVVPESREWHIPRPAGPVACPDLEVAVRAPDDREKPGDLRFRSAQREPTDPDFWQNVCERGARGDYVVQPGDDEYPRRDIIRLEDEVDAERQQTRTLRRERARVARGRAKGAARARDANALRIANEDRALKARAEGLRRREELSMSQIAKRLGCSRRTLARILGTPWAS